MSPVDRIAELFAAEGAADYLGEPVTLGAHLLQAGALSPARAQRPRAGHTAVTALVVACEMI
jgi:predicted HD phosphohydrolase